jgi:hypothetical protein
MMPGELPTYQSTKHYKEWMYRSDVLVIFNIVLFFMKTLQLLEISFKKG